MDAGLHEIIFRLRLLVDLRRLTGRYARVAGRLSRPTADRPIDCCRRLDRQFVRVAAKFRLFVCPTLKKF